VIDRMRQLRDHATLPETTPLATRIRAERLNADGVRDRPRRALARHDGAARAPALMRPRPSPPH